MKKLTRIIDLSGYAAVIEFPDRSNIESGCLKFMPGDNKTHGKPEDKKEDQHPEDWTADGEFILTFHHWISSEEQRKKAKKLEEEIDT